MYRFSLIKTFPLVAIVAVFALAAGGCDGPGNLFGGGETPEETPTESPVAVSPTDDEAEQAEQPAANEPVAQDTPLDDSPVTASLPRDLDLIPSTDPDQRLQTLGSERNDPFSLVPTTPSVQITITETPEAAPTATTTGTGTPAQSPTATAPTTGNGTGQAPTVSSPGGLAPIPNLVPQPSPVATAPLPPPPPQPVLARAVEVLGVVQIGSTPYAIVNAPNEASSRYVRVGQRLSNGQVVVKRIEMSGPEPAVVFEQFGIEVITSVGEGGSPADSSPTAALPNSANSRNQLS